MLDICKKFRRSDLADFLELLYLKKITLISKSEAADRFFFFFFFINRIVHLLTSFMYG